MRPTAACRDPNLTGSKSDFSSASPNNGGFGRMLAALKLYPVPCSPLTLDLPGWAMDGNGSWRGALRIAHARSRSGWQLKANSRRLTSGLRVWSCIRRALEEEPCAADNGQEAEAKADLGAPLPQRRSRWKRCPHRCPPRRTQAILRRSPAGLTALGRQPPLGCRRRQSQCSS